MKTATNTTATSATSLAIERGGAFAGTGTGSRVAGSSGRRFVAVADAARRRSLPVGRRFVAHPGRA